MAKYQPTGNSNNAFSWTHIFNTDKPQVEAKLSRAGASDLYKDKMVIRQAVGTDKFEKFITARYDWLFDDLQKFSSIGAENINTKEDLKRFVEDTIGKSKGFESMKEKNPRRYNASINRATNSLWVNGGVSDVAKTNVVEVVTPERADRFKVIVREDKRDKFLRASEQKELFRIRREQFAIKGTDKRGRVFYYDVKTGRRTQRPDKTLREVGFE